MDEKLFDKVLKKLDVVLDEKTGLKLSGQGMIANNTKKIIEVLDQDIQKKLYFMEQRQQRMEEVQSKILLAIEKLIKK